MKGLFMIKRYDKFIESRKHRVLEENTYTEKHHILPRCQGGEDSDENLIRLTAREHFIVHKMLYRENRNSNELAYAYHCMTHMKFNGRDYKVTSRDYELAKSASKTPWNKGLTKETDEILQKTSEKLKGKKCTSEHRTNISKSCKGKEAWNKGKKGVYTKEGTEKRRQSQLNLKKGYHYRCVETGNIIYSVGELREYVNNPKAQMQALHKASKSGSIRYGFHWVKLN